MMDMRIWPVLQALEDELPVAVASSNDVVGLSRLARACRKLADNCDQRIADRRTEGGLARKPPKPETPLTDLDRLTAVDLKHLCELFSISPDWVRDHYSELGAVEFGSALRFPIVNVQRYLDSHKYRPENRRRSL